MPQTNQTTVSDSSPVLPNVLVEASEEAFEIRPADAQILHRLAGEEVHEPLYRAIERSLPYHPLASR